METVEQVPTRVPECLFCIGWAMAFTCATFSRVTTWGERIQSVSLCWTMRAQPISLPPTRRMGWANIPTAALKR